MNAHVPTMKPGESIKANLNEDDVKKIALQLYAIKVVFLEELNGYDDKNYYIKNEEGRELVIKFINLIDSNKPEIFEAQSLLLVHLNKHGISCPVPIKTKNGLYFEKYELESGCHIVRALNFISGVILLKVPCNSDLFYEIGKCAADMNTAMKSFRHPAYKNYKSIWMLESVPDILPFLFAVDNPSRQKLVTIIVNEFKEKVLQRSHNFPRGLIHGDINEQNIIVDKNDEGKYKIRATIDYGDCHVGCYLYELAITMSYMILLAEDVEAGGYVFTGYVSVRSISDEECSLIKLCIAARLCQSLVLGAYTNQQDPSNTYVLSTAVHGWQLLEKFWSEDNEKLIKLWKDTSINKSLLAFEAFNNND